MATGRVGPDAAASPKPGTPGYLKWYWTAGPGRTKWTSWTELFAHLRKHMAEAMAKRVAAQWFHDVKGIWPGDHRNI